MRTQQEEQLLMLEGAVRALCDKNGFTFEGCRFDDIFGFQYGMSVGPYRKKCYICPEEIRDADVLRSNLGGIDYLTSKIHMSVAQFKQEVGWMTEKK